MSADERFLARWSRRKRDAAVSRKPTISATPDASQPAPAPTAPEPAQPVDSASLPPIDSIGAGSDLTPFLAPGVPAELMRAALRRAWSADPAIRDFIGLSENAWDFTAPGGVPGFGSVTAEDVERLLRRLTDETAETAGARSASDQSSTSQVTVIGQDDADHAAPGLGADTNEPPPQRASAAVQSDARRPRRHGGALPE